MLVIDTNVLVVANDKHKNASSGCRKRCREKLSNARKTVTLIDQQQHVLAEYKRHCSHSGQPGLGDAFFKWLWENQANEKYVRVVEITPCEKKGFAEFPDDPALVNFDMDDRKFVSVAVAAGTSPHICNASDTDWWEFKEALFENGISIEFLCPELMKS